ncbi:MAG TPA: Fic family protein [Syntrophorhabdaceae bacterium]|jgi:Fic family protein
MKIPEKPPLNWRKYISSEILASPPRALQEAIRKGNRDYIYWDKFKYLVPEGISRESAWAALKLSRTLNARDLPLVNRDTNNNFTYWQPDRVLEYLYQINRDASGAVITGNLAVQGSERKLFLLNSIMEEAIASSQIEGAVTTTNQAKEMLQRGEKPKDRSQQMIYNNYATISRIKDLIEFPASPVLLKELQESMTRDTLDSKAHAGRFRTASDKPVYVMNFRGDILHVPTPPEHIEEEIGKLCDFANRALEEFIHPVIKGIVLHFWLAYIHPFHDGNGRTARALFYWNMLRNHYPLFEYISISKSILRSRADYYRSFLYSETDEGDMTYFIAFNLKTISAALDQLHEYLERKGVERQVSAREFSAFPGLNHRQQEVLRRVLEDPGVEITLKDLMQTYHVVHQTARTDILDLTNAKLLEKKVRGKRFYFVAAQDLAARLAHAS